MGQRQLVVCTFCKRRKIKCNKEKPCDSCTRYRNPKCEYRDGNTDSTENLLLHKLIRKVASLEKKILSSHPLEIAGEQSNLDDVFDAYDVLPSEELYEEDEMNLFDHYDSMDQGTFVGPLSFIALIKVDPEMRVAWKEILHDPHLKTIYNVTYPRPLRLQTNVFPLGAVNDQILFDDILKALPRYADIVTLLDYFFKWVYPVFPIVDEFELKRFLASSFGDDGMQTPSLLDREDLIYYGHLLAVIRIAYSSNSNLPVVADTAIALANACLNKFDIFRTNDFVHFQLMLLLLAYQLHAPEYGDGMGQASTNVFLPILVEKAYLLGLHRDPLVTDPDLIDGRVNNLKRKCWFWLMILDSLVSIGSASPTHFTKLAFDTKRVYSNSVNHNTSDVVSEEFSSSLSSDGPFDIRMVRGYIKSLHNLDEAFKLKTMKRVLEFLYNSVTGDVKIFKDFIETDDKQKIYYVKTFKIKFFFQALCPVISMYYYMFQYYMKQDKLDKAISVITRCTTLMFKHVLPILLEVIDEIVAGDKQPYQESFCKFILYSSLQGLLHKMVTVTLSMYLKATVELRESLKKVLDLLLNKLLSLSSICFFSWRMLKFNKRLYEYIDTHKLFSNKLSSPEIIEVIKDALTAVDFNVVLKEMELTVDDNIWIHVITMPKIDNEDENFPFTSS